MSAAVRVLIVDDSAVVRRALQRGLEKQPGIEVVGTAPDPYVARDKVLSLRPDVITLDIQMPRMDGLTFLRKLMRFHPVPTIIVSSLTPAGCDTAIACLEAGAVDVLPKPTASYTIAAMTMQLADLIRAAATASLGESDRRPGGASARTPMAAQTQIECTRRVIALGASIGGPQALSSVLSVLPKQVPAIIMTLHMPAGFTTSFAKRLDSLSQIDVREAKDGDALAPGLALLAPGDHHMRLARVGTDYLVRVGSGPRVCRHRPSVEVLFESTAEHAGRDGMGVIMTGMGDDGAKGLLSMRRAGAMTVAQDEASCVVFGMPGAAVKHDAASIISPLLSIPEHIMDFARAAPASTAA